MNQIALITGANRGLGFATARRLANDGALIIIGARDAETGERAATQLRDEGSAAESLVLDVTSEQSVQEAAATVAERHGRLDVLVNNAGILPEIGADGSPGALSSRLFAATYDTNVFGVVRMVEAFLPLLRRSRAARIVNVSSTMGSLADQTDPQSPYFALVVPAYQSSKAALNAITIALSKALADTPIKVNSVCPGFVQTDLTPISRAQAPTTASEASSVVAAMARLAADGPTGSFVDRDGVVAW